MKNNPYHSWKAPRSFRVATGSLALWPVSCGRETPRCTRWLHRRNTVPSRSDTDNFFIRVIRNGNPPPPPYRICQCAKDHAGCLPVVYMVMPDTTRKMPETTRIMISERWSGMLRGEIREYVKAPLTWVTEAIYKFPFYRTQMRKIRAKLRSPDCSVPAWQLLFCSCICILFKENHTKLNSRETKLQTIHRHFVMKAGNNVRSLTEWSKFLLIDHRHWRRNTLSTQSFFYMFIKYFYYPIFFFWGGGGGEASH